LIILGSAKSEEEREFYLRLTIQEKYSKRELERQINCSVFERVMIGNAKLSEVPREMNSDITKALRTIMFSSS
jgi:predicted nuclease of restriction endonuclease-like (RecB) superfamily